MILAIVAFVLPPTLIQESRLLLLSPGVPAHPLGQSDSFRSSVCKMR